MKIILTPFMILAAVGLLLSIVVHVAGLLGLPDPLGEAAWGLHVGIFVVWIPAVIVAGQLSKDFKQKDLWKAVLRGCPRWMKYMAYFFFGYAILNFVLFIAFVGIEIGHGPGRTSGGSTPTAIFRGFSGHWMAFYSMALAMLYSAAHVREHDNARKCLNGHPVSPSGKFCEECGAEVQGPTDDSRPKR